jgi:hypothetical protein
MMVPISAVACSTDGSMPYSRWLRSRRRVNSALHHIRRQLVESRGPPPIRGCHEVPALRLSVPRARAGPDPAALGPKPLPGRVRVFVVSTRTRPLASLPQGQSLPYFGAGAAQACKNLSAGKRRMLS